MGRGKDLPKSYKESGLWNIQENVVANPYILKAIRELGFVKMLENFVNKRQSVQMIMNLLLLQVVNARNSEIFL